MVQEPTSITKVEDKLKIIWKDGHEGASKIKHLRDECPCASCKGETILFKTYKPQVQIELPNKYEIKNISLVGSYAVQIFWQDGHDTGIYSWEYLRLLCQCEVCNKLSSKGN